MTPVDISTQDISVPPIAVPERAGQPPTVSFGQERIWFTEQLTPGTAGYNVHATVRLRGAVRPGTLGAALDAAAVRHDSLRMRFVESEQGEPLVEILPAVFVPLTLTVADDEAETRSQVDAFVRKPFDLTVAPLLRALLVRLAEDDHVLHVDMHHIVSDGWSLTLLLDEIAELYGSLRNGTPPPAAPTLGYADYAAWQRDRIDGPVVRAELAHWTAVLDGVAPLDLPTDRPRPAVQTHAGASHRFVLDASLTTGLRALGRAKRATLYMTLLAGFQAVLSRYSGQHDFAVGTPVAGRVVPELEGIVGLFVNTLALRADLSGSPTFDLLLRRTRTAVVTALSHQEVPFERLVKELNVERDVSRSSVFQVLFTLQNYARAAGRWPDGITASGFGADEAAAQFDLSLYVSETDTDLRAMLVYNTDLFDRATIERFAQHYVALLRAAVADPSCAVADLELLDDAERGQLLELAGVSLHTQEKEAGTLADVIAPHVAATPGAPAVVCEGDVLTYAELDRRSNRLAHRLRQAGLGPDALVGVCLPQSVDLAVALLGVLKAGGAYLPLDPEQPQARLDLMLADARPALVLDDVAQVAAHGYPETVVAGTVHPANLAYVIYTSGSTGVPKGVGVAHREVLHYLAGVADRFEIVPGSRYALLQSMSFDFSVTVFYLALSTGGAVHLLPRRGTGAELAEALRTHDIDYLKITPSHLHALTADATIAELLPRRALIFGGEASDGEWAAGLAAAGETRVFNHYGPTEATVGLTTFEVLGSEPGTVPIGRPLPRARVHVLDARLRQVPIGVRGQIYLGGERLARGYLNRPGLTATRFVPDPFGARGDRLYRTGDLGRWRADGQLVFLGRGDDQVKIRGYRVELGEIEAALAEHPAVRQAVVLLRGDRLVAYVEGDEEASDLRRALADKLPEYMIPARYVWLDALPLQDHGKVDRKALPDPGDPAPSTGGVAPGGPIETLIAGIWQDVIGLAEVGATDDFFDIGGHSLLATQVVARLRRALPPGVSVSVMDLFRHRTVRELAAHVGTGDGGTARLLHELTPRGRNAAVTLVCVPYGGGSAVVYQPLADALPDDHRLLSIAMPGHDIGTDDEPAPIEEVAEAVVAEILAEVKGRLILYGHCGPGGALAVEIARRLEEAGRDIEAMYLGAVFPFGRPNGGLLAPVTRLRIVDRIRSDRIYRTWLQAQGTSIGALEPEEAAFLIRAMRHDARVSEEYFTGLLERKAGRLRTPIVSVVGERDRGTDFYEERYREWGFLSDRTALAVIEEGGHYFLKYRADELAGIVTTRHHDLKPVEQEHDGPQPSMRRFGLVASGQIVATTGTALTNFAIPLWIYLQTGSLVRFALFAIISLLPGLIVAPLAGALIDRTNRRKILLLANLAAVAPKAVVAGMLLADRAEVWHFYALVGWLSVALAFQRLAFVSAVPQLVPKVYLGHANGLAQTALGTAQFLVPLIAVALLDAVDLRGILLIDVAAYAIAVVVLLAVRFPRTLALQRRESLGAEIIGGLRYSLRRREFRAMLGFFAALNLFLFPVLFLLSPLVLGFADLAQVAQVALIGGAGAALGGLVMLIWGGPRHYRMRAVLLGTLGIAVACFITGLRPNLVVIGAGAFGMFLALGLVNGIYNTIIQIKVPTRFHGRVFALNQMVAFSTLPLGWGVIAPLASAWLEPLLMPGGALAPTAGAVIGAGPGRGIGLLYLIFGVGIALTAIISLMSRRLARFDDEVPDAPPDDLIGIEEIEQRAAQAGKASR